MSGLNITMARHTEGEIFGIPSTGQQKITVGNFCSIAGNCSVFTEPSHNAKFISTYSFHNKAFSHITPKHPPIVDDLPIIHRGELVIGNDVWLGWGTRMFTGLTIGDGAVIGAYSLVTKDVPPYAIVAGHPTRLIRMRFSDEDIDFLLKLKWWDFPDEVIAEIAHLLQNPNVELLKQWAKENGRWNG